MAINKNLKKLLSTSVDNGVVSQRVVEDCILNNCGWDGRSEFVVNLSASADEGKKWQYAVEHDFVADSPSEYTIRVRPGTVITD